MKTRTLWVVFIVLIFWIGAIGSSAIAETQKSEKPLGEKHMMDKETKEKEWMWHRMGDMPMHGMMFKQMIATSDGGVVVTIGNKLYKYDSTLNLQKEVEIPVDMEGMKKMMTNMRETWKSEEKTEKHEEAAPKGSSEKK